MGRVYKMTDPRNGLIRYVGATTVPLHHRLKAHMGATRPDAYGRVATAPVVGWVSELLELGLRPAIAELVVVDRGDLVQAERGAIASHYHDGWPLLNVADMPRDYDFSESRLAALTKRLERVKPFGGDLLRVTEDHLARVRAEVTRIQRYREEAARRNPGDPKDFGDAARLWVEEWNATAEGHAFKPLLRGERRATVEVAIVEVATAAHKYGIQFERIAQEVGRTVAMDWGQQVNGAA
jgi:hypothetical protein